MLAPEVGQRLGDVSQGLSKEGKEAPPRLQTPSQGLGCLGLNACQGSSCLLRWELTHPRSLLTPLSHMLLPGAFQGRVEVSAEACERTRFGMPSCPARSPPASGTSCQALGTWHHGITSGCRPGLLRARAGTEPGGKARTGTRGRESASHPDGLQQGWVFSPLLRSGSDEG